MPTAWVDFKRIKAEVSFEAILERYGISFRREGRELVARCPFHEDQRPSLRVNTDKRVWLCFGCGARGNVLDFIVRKDGATIKEAARRAAEWSGITLEAPRAEKAAIAQETTAPEESIANAPLTFALKLEREHPYLTERGLSPELIETFGVGYARRGLLKGRIAIPIHDAEGQLVAYAGRWPGRSPPEGEPKYKLPARFKKSAVVFNLHRVRGVEHLVVVEGPWSVFKLHELGIPAVALLGCSVSREQRDALAGSGARRLTLLFDGDAPGREAAASHAVEFARTFFVHIANVPEGTQPDTLPGEELCRLLEEGRNVA